MTNYMTMFMCGNAASAMRAFAAAAFLLFLPACMKTEEPVSVQDDGFIELAFTKNGFVDDTQDMPSVKADVGEDGSGTFTEGDKVGLYIYGSPSRHVILTLENGRWTPALKKSDLGSGTARLSAYYPVSEAEGIGSNVHRHKVQTDQSGDGYMESDLLWSHLDIDLGSLSGNRIEFPFRHAMHRLVINITGSDGTLPEDLSVKVLNETEGSLSIYSGSLNDPSGEKVRIDARKAEGSQGKFSAILFPGSLGPYSDGWVEITAGGKTSTFKAPSEIGGRDFLESGKETVLNLSLNQGGVGPGEEPEPEPDPDYAGKICWVYGVKTPETPDYNEETVKVLTDTDKFYPWNFPSGVWFKFDSDPETAYLNWQEGFRWYDCDKDNPDESNSRPGYHDSNMCWAAASACMLHWWMNINSDYIAAYDRKYGDVCPKYPRPSSEFSGTEKSEIFNFFREASRNRGGDARDGINWFINHTPGLGLNDTFDDDAFGGYFTEVFKGMKIADSFGGFSKETFNELIKDALENDRGLGFIRSHGLTHVMALYGVEFDDEGYISAVYYVDNNDYYNFQVTGSSTPFQRHRLIRKKITYNEGSGFKILIGEGTSYAIVGVTTMDLMRDVWRNAFPEVRTDD